MSPVAGQTAGSHHSPEFFFLHEEAGLIRQRVGYSVVLMLGVHHDVRTIKRRSSGIVVEERAVGREDIPCVVNVKIAQAQPKREMHPCYRHRADLEGNELALRKHLPVVIELPRGIRRLARVNPSANINDGRVIRWLDETEAI